MNRKLFTGQFPNQQEVGEMSSDGVVYGGRGVHKEPIGFVTEDGRVYEKEGLTEKYKGRVDSDGYIYTGEGALEHKVGKVDSDGTVYGSPGSIAFFSALKLPIGQIRDDIPADKSSWIIDPGNNTKNWQGIWSGKGVEGSSPKPSRVLPEGAALLLLFQK